MGAQAAVARSIAGVYIIYPPCYATLCYAMLHSCYATSGVAMGCRSSVALNGTRCYGWGATLLFGGNK